MTKKEIVDGLQFTIDMFCFNPSTGEVIAKNRLNEESRLTVDACEGAIEIIKALEQVDESVNKSVGAISRQAVIDAIDKWVKNMGVLVALPVNEVTPLFESIHELPPVNPQPKVGHWIVYDVHGHKACKCSECDKDAGYPCYDKYCSHCGSYNGGERI